MPSPVWLVLARVLAGASVALDADIFTFLPGNRAAIYRVNADGFPRIDVVALSLTGR